MNYTTISPENLFDFNKLCRQHSVGVPGYVLLDRNNGLPLMDGSSVQTVSGQEALFASAIYDLGLLPSSIHTVVFEIEARSRAHLNVMLHRHRADFALVTCSTKPARVPQDRVFHAWAISGQAETVGTEPIFFLGQKVGRTIGCGDFIAVNDLLLSKLINSSSFWRTCKFDRCSDEIDYMTNLRAPLQRNVIGPCAGAANDVL